MWMRLMLYAGNRVKVCSFSVGHGLNRCGAMFEHWLLSWQCLCHRYVDTSVHTAYVVSFKQQCTKSPGSYRGR